jgi:geranylgeranyl diphosphate synthase type II
LTDEFADLEAGLERRRQRVDGMLRELMPEDASTVGRAVSYSLNAPAKRLRPVVALLVTEMLSGDVASVLPAACALELVHTASLILDDLPSMDDATLRRGRPACHVAHGEATALLAAFALQNRAFEILAAGWPGAPAPTARQTLAVDLAAAVGLDGMIAGQAADLDMTGRAIDFATLEFIHSRKTGALFIAAAALGAVGAGADGMVRAAVQSYAKNLGLAFQIVDDLLDVTGTAAVMGKDSGQDLKKTTFVSFAGVDGARQLAQELAAASVQSLVGFGPGAEPLRGLARYVVARRR